MCKSKSSNASNKGTIGTIFHTSTGLDALKVNETINSIAITMKIDTGATYSILNDVDWKKIGSPKLQSTNITLKTYDGSALRVRDQVDVYASLNNHTANVPVLVVSSQSAPSLLVRDWLLEFSIDWQSCRHLKRSSSSDTVHEVTADSIVNEFADLFTEKLGLIKGVCAHVQL